jgi:hypothetical protein
MDTFPRVSPDRIKPMIVLAYSLSLVLRAEDRCGYDPSWANGELVARACECRSGPALLTALLAKGATA